VGITETGVLTLVNGDVYDGMWSQGLKHGRGKYKWTNLDTYEGTFSKGARDGHGVIQFSNGSRYEGMWRNNLK
jgi:hypothetical protein